MRLVLVSPSHQFPSGVVMSLKRRIELLQATARHNSWIFEDDYDGEFRYGARPIAALRSLDGGERVIYVGTFSKSMFPSLRLGYIVCPRGLREDLLTAKHLDDGGCPAIDQAALAAFMQGRQFEKHLRESAAELNRRRCALLEGLARWVGPHIEMSESQAGMHVIVWFPRLNYAQLERLIQLGAARGLGLARRAPALSHTATAPRSAGRIRRPVMRRDRHRHRAPRPLRQRARPARLTARGAGDPATPHPGVVMKAVCPPLAFCALIVAAVAVAARGSRRAEVSSAPRRRPTPRRRPSAMRS